LVVLVSLEIVSVVAIIETIVSIIVVVVVVAVHVWPRVLVVGITAADVNGIILHPVHTWDEWDPEHLQLGGEVEHLVGHHTLKVTVHSWHTLHGCRTLCVGFLLGGHKVSLLLVLCRSLLLYRPWLLCRSRCPYWLGGNSRVLLSWSRSLLDWSWFLLDWSRFLLDRSWFLLDRLWLLYRAGRLNRSGVWRLNRAYRTLITPALAAICISSASIPRIMVLVLTVVVVYICCYTLIAVVFSFLAIALSVVAVV